jgi:hypothetical protein
MKNLRELFKKVKPIYIILGLFIVVIIVSALGSKKEGMASLSSYDKAALKQFIADRDDIFSKIVTFANAHKGWDNDNTFISTVKSYLDLYFTMLYQSNVKSYDTNKDGMIIVDSNDNFIRDNSNPNNTLQLGEKLFLYNPLGNQDGDQVSKTQVTLQAKNIENKINLLKNDNDKALISNLIGDILDKTSKINKISVRSSPVVSFKYYKVPYPIKIGTTHPSSDYNYKPTNKSPFVMGTSPPTIEWAASNNNAAGTSPWSASVCGDNSTSASSASIDCINSLWQQNGCTPNMVKTSNPNFLMDSKTNQLYDITNQTLGVMKKMMNETAKNPTYCYGSVSPKADSKTSVNGGSADYWKNLYLSAVSVPSDDDDDDDDRRDKKKHTKYKSVDSSNKKNPSYDSMFIPSGAPLAGDGKSTDSSGNNTGSGSPSGSNTSSGGGVGAASTQDMYLLSNQASSNCPVGGCGTGASAANNCKPSPVPPCPPCDRCPEPAFDCKKVPSYGSAANNQYLPRPVLADFSQFGM